MNNLNEIQKEFASRELARRHYKDYLAYAHDNWKKTRMSSFLADQVQEFIEADTGHAYDILVVNCPPQHGKSMTITESLPSWYLGKYPGNHVIIASYDSDFAERFCKKNKEKIRNVGKQLFGIKIGSIDRAAEFELEKWNRVRPVEQGTVLSSTKDGTENRPQFHNSPGGRLIARGIMSGITGNPANLVIIDDPVKNQLEADSPTYRQRLWGEWQSSIKTRLAAHSKIIIIMTPWREDCFDREVLRTEANVRHISLPVEAGKDDPMGRKPGDSLCPELGKDNNWLAEFRVSYIHDPLGGQRAWSAMYLCSPRVEEGYLIKREWWRYYKHADEPKAFGAQIISVDAAFKGDDNNDFVSIQVWGKLGADYYLRYCVNEHLDFPRTLDKIRKVAKNFPEARTVLIEEAANGAAIISVLQKELCVIPVTPLGGKVARVNAVASQIESGHVYLPDPSEQSWIAEYVNQWTAFPNGKHDDMVDASTQALSRLFACSGEVWGTTRKQENPVPAFTDMYNVYRGGLNYERFIFNG